MARARLEKVSDHNVYSNVPMLARVHSLTKYLVSDFVASAACTTLIETNIMLVGNNTS